VKSFGVVAFVLWSLFGVNVALADDLPLPTIGAPSLLPIGNAYASSAHWAGAYLGINGGYGVGSSQWTLGGFWSNVFNTGGFLFGGTVASTTRSVKFCLASKAMWTGLPSTAGRLVAL
jgi:hypothetical protein